MIIRKKKVDLVCAAALSEQNVSEALCVHR